MEDCGAMGAPKQVDHPRQLAAVSGSERLSVSAQLFGLDWLDRLFRSLLDRDGFQAGRSHLQRVTLSSIIAAPDRRSRFRLDLAGQTKFREFDADLAESCALDRCPRRQATVLALCRSAHHHKLCVGKFDTHDPTFLSS